MDDAQQEVLTKARIKREEVIGRINAILGRLEVDHPPNFTPFTASQAVEVSAGFHEAATKLLNAAQESGVELSEELKAATERYEQARDGLMVDFDPTSTPVAVVSLAGLERIESLLSELEQQREGAGA